MSQSISKHIEEASFSSSLPRELAKFRQWMRVGYVSIGILLIWNVMITARLSVLQGKEVSLVPTVAALKISDSDVAMSEISQGNSSLEVFKARDVELSSENHLESRITVLPSAMDFTDNTRLALVGSIAVTGFSLWVTSAGMIGMTSDCKALHEEGGALNANQCLAGVATNAIFVGATLRYVYDAYHIYGTVRQALHLKYGDGSSAKMKRMPSLLDAMSAELGSEVAHIGEWDASEHYELNKRDDATVPVFGTKVNGSDIHFSILEREDNSTTFHIGYGPGENTEANQRLRRRTYMWNEMYFEHGGMDFKATTAPDLNKEKIYMNDQRDFDWLNKQVECYINKLQPPEVPDGIPLLETIGGISDFALNYKALQFQVYNDIQNITLEAGVVAPFINGGKSAIDEVDIALGLNADATCAGEDKS